MTKDDFIKVHTDSLYVQLLPTFWFSTTKYDKNLELFQTNDNRLICSDWKTFDWKLQTIIQKPPYGKHKK